MIISNARNALSGWNAGSPELRYHWCICPCVAPRMEGGAHLHFAVIKDMHVQDEYPLSRILQIKVFQNMFSWILE